jgi:hypothetical protein
VVDESDPAVELGVAGEAFFDAGHADQDEPDACPVVVVAELLERGGLEPVGFVDDQQFGEGPVGLAEAGAGIEVLTGVQGQPDAPAQPGVVEGDPLSTVRGVLATVGV